MTSREQLENAWLETCLEERLSGATPPDLTRQILARAAEPTRGPNRAKFWLAAAVLLIALGVVLAISASLSDRDARDQTRHATPQGDGQDDGQDKKSPERPPVSGNRIEPKSVAALRKLLPRLRSVRMELRLLGKHNLPVKAVDEPGGPEITIVQGMEEATRFRRLLAKSLSDKRLSLAWKWPHRLELVLDNHDYVEACVQRMRDGTCVLGIHGLGTLPCSDDLVTFLSKRAFVASLDIRTREKHGIVHASELLLLPKTQTRIRAHGFAAKNLASLAQRFGRLHTLDLRYSPEVNRDLAQLVVLRNLRKLKLAGNNMNRSALRHVAKLSLEELAFLDPENGAWHETPKPAAAWFDDDDVAELATMKTLRVLVLPGSAITDQGLSTLARHLPNLRRLVLTGNTRLTGSGFVAFHKHRNLDDIYLHRCTNLSDAGLRALAEIPRLRQLYLARARNDRLTAAGLRALSTSPQLRRLHLDGWFAGQRPDKDWLAAFGGLGKLPRLDWLSLADCSGLLLADLKPMKGAPLTTLVLSGVVGKQVGKIPPEDVDILWDLFPRFQTLIYTD